MSKKQNRDETLWMYQKLGWNPLLLCHPDHTGLPKHHYHVCSKPGKVPIGSWKHLQTKAYSETDLFAQMTKYPQSNVGIITGKVSGLIGVDLDTPQAVDWFKSFRQKDKDNQKDIVTFQTSRGYRLLYRHNNNHPWPPSGVLFNGVEILAEGRQTVMPYSKHESGFIYTWLDNYDFSKPLPLFPDSFYSLAAKAVKPTQVGIACETEIEQFTEYRNERLFRLASALRRFGGKQDEIFQCLSIFNERCVPPLTELDLNTICKSVMRYKPVHFLPTALPA